MLRLGIVDCDTSHVVAFTQRLNHQDIEEQQWVEGARVVAAVPGTSLIAPDSIDRYTEQLRGYGVKIVGSIADLLDQVDAVLIESVDGQMHVERTLPVIEAGLPVFVDKPFTTNTTDASRIIEAAETRGVPLTSASALRYALEVQAVKNQPSDVGPIRGVDTYGPANLHPRNPGLFHYGVHAVEMLYTLMGTGCQSVSCFFTQDAEVVVGEWADGRLGTVRGTRYGTYGFGFTAFGQQRTISAAIDSRYYYRELLKIVVGMFQTRQWPLTAQELWEPVAFQEAALQSCQRDGARISLAKG
jgi:predicted dehydrogenase